jgi:hypothetical protein
MKTFVCAILLSISTIGILGALDLQSYDFIEYLLRRGAAGAPEIFEDSLIFTAPSTYKRVGIAFAHENFENIHWFKKLLVPRENPAKFDPPPPYDWGFVNFIPIEDTEILDPEKRASLESLKDSGVLFYVHTVTKDEQDKNELLYRLVVDGLWTSDPLNPRRRFDTGIGLELSLATPPKLAQNSIDKTEGEGALTLKLKAAPGEAITVAGDFNGWDPFMYPLHEERAGNYSLTLPLPAGTWRYVLFYRGSRILDPYNMKKVYAIDGSQVNVIEIQ